MASFIHFYFLRPRCCMEYLAGNYAYYCWLYWPYCFGVGYHLLYLLNLTFCVWSMIYHQLIIKWQNFYLLVKNNFSLEFVLFFCNRYNNNTISQNSSHDIKSVMNYYEIKSIIYKPIMVKLKRYNILNKFKFITMHCCD